MTQKQSELDRTAEQETSHVKCEVKTWHLRHKQDGTQEKISVEGFGQVDASANNYALTVTRKLDKNHNLESTTLDVNSPHILKAFRDVVKSHPTIASDFTSPFSVQIPSEMLFHRWDELEKYQSELKDDTAREHLDLLLHFMDFDMGAARKSYQTQIRSGLVEFARLGILFRPEDIVLCHSKSHPWLMRVERTAYEHSEKRGKYFDIHCSYSDYDGQNYGMSKRMFRFYQKEHFGSEHPAKILNLEVYPRAHALDDADLEYRLRERGKLFLSFTDVSVRQYDGPAEYLKTPPRDFFHPKEDQFCQLWMPYHETGRVIVDRKTFEQDHPSQYISRTSLESLDPTLCPPFVLGYSSSRKEWSRFYVPNLQEVKWKSDAFNDLILPESQLRLVRALVTSHKFSKDPRDEDQQKGKGLVCLLHGPPGSGKTLTAECAAEITEKALIRASMSELNKFDSPWHFEKSLAKILRLATAWKAVVLLDEADVFLEARDESADAAQRNAMVAVFLRHLEYFAGIVFLTTNRIHVFDAAMKSRVHLALGYSDPDEDARRMIWRQSFRRILSEDSSLDVEQVSFILCPEKLNGREISNAIHTASTLARYSSEDLALGHIKEVLGVRKDFEATLQRMRTSKKHAITNGPELDPLARRNSILSKEVDGVNG